MPHRDSRTGWAMGIAAGCVALLLGPGCSESDSSAAGAGANGAGASSGSTGGAGGSGGVLNVGGSAGDVDGSVGGTGGQAPVGCGNVVTGTVRDFHAGVDFQCNNSGFTDTYQKDCGPWDPAIVGALGSSLGSDQTPVYASTDKTPSTTGAADFSQWYHDTPGVNMTDALKLTMVAGQSGTFVYDEPFFFPIDGKLFAADPNDPDKDKYFSDDGKARNFHFTYELHTQFRYDPGNVFTFRGDDDVFVYINRKLAVNLGGIHVPLQGVINLDTGRVEITVPSEFQGQLPDLQTAPEYGFDEKIPNGVAGTVQLDLTPGQVYDMDFFFNERNCCASNFRVETNFVFVDCGQGPVK